MLPFAIVLASCSRHDAADRNDAIAQLETTLRPPRTFVPRLSIATAYRACAVAAAQQHGGILGGCVPEGQDSLIPRSEAFASFQRSLASSRLLTADAIHASALLDLTWGDTAGKSLDRSISSLDMLLRLTDSSAAMLNDLAAAYLLRADRYERPRDAVAALDLEQRAIRKAPRMATARFNRALALGWLGIDEEAIRAWRDYLSIDSTSRWADEARGRTPRLKAVPPATQAETALGASRFAESYPEASRAYGFEQLLDRWARDSSAARDSDGSHALAIAESIGVSLVHYGGDGTLLEAVRFIQDSVPDVRARRSLQAAHQAYAQALRSYARTNLAEANGAATRALSQPGISDALRDWALVTQGASFIGMQSMERGEKIFRGLVATVDSAHYPALAARAEWALGTTLLRRGHYDEGFGALRIAQGLYAKIHESENLGATLAIDGEASFIVGIESDGYRLTHRALLALSGFPSSVWRHNAVYVLAQRAADDGYDAALPLLWREDEQISRRLGATPYVAEAQLARLRALWAAGAQHEGAALEHVLNHLIDSIPDSQVRARMHAEVQLSRSWQSEGPDTVATSALDSAIAFFKRGNSPTKLIPAFVARAGRAAARADYRAAEQNLDSAVAALDEQKRHIRTASQRAAFLSLARSVFERMMLVRLARGDSQGGLDALERGRALSVGAPSATAGRTRTALDDSETLLDYALVGDTLLRWTVDRSGQSLSRRVLPRTLVSQTISRARLGLQRSSTDSITLRALAQLGDWLIPTSVASYDTRHRLLIVADQEIADVPFPALWDSTHQRFLIESAPLRFSTSLGDAHSTARRTRATRALFVAEPSVDPRVFFGLPATPATVSEVKASAAAYPSPTILTRTDADSARVASAIGRAQVFHFAGHALFDEDAPDRSVLAVAPRGLSGSAIASMDLHGLRLVVLSACETARAPEHRSSAFGGFAESFLAAGALGVVGSLWPVGDAPTAQMMVDFHSTYAREGDAASALRTAQLASINRQRGSRDHSMDWAAFRYVGR